jgi:NTP pyrophosphatase (non-canonical NTP hydrolase)
MGMATEAGEFLDMLKKHIFYGKPMDFVNAKEEIGDQMWYAGLAVDVLQTTFNEVLTVNIDKLKARYPEKFTEEAAINRDLNTERSILER